MFGLFYKYNRDMMNENYNTPNSGCCGRPMQYATEPECNWTCGPATECCGCTLGRIKKDADPCKSCAYIPAITVETTDGIANLANCFVHVTGINTTYYIDDKHRPMITWAGPVETDLPSDIETQEQFDAFIKSFDLRSQFLYVKFTKQDTGKKVIDSFYFSKTGKIYFAGEFEEIEEA